MNLRNSEHIGKLFTYVISYQEDQTYDPAFQEEPCMQSDFPWIYTDYHKVCYV